MNYQRHYTLLIQRATNRILDGYYEKHHIIPKCIGGNNSRENIVKLTPEEHYIAHQLLIKIYPKNHSLKKAAWMMCVKSGNQKRNNKAYGWIKRNARPIGNSNGMFGKTHTDEIKNKLGELAKERFSGKTYEELYGDEKAELLRLQRSEDTQKQRKLTNYTGKLNPNAKIYKFISPDGTEYIVEGNLKKFCNDNNLWIEKMIKIAKGEIESYKSWKVYYVKR